MTARTSERWVYRNIRIVFSAQPHVTLTGLKAMVPVRPVPDVVLSARGPADESLGEIPFVDN